MDFSLLTPQELEIECVVRGIAPNSKDALVNLHQSYEKELIDASQIPQESHASKNPRSELTLLASRIEELKTSLVSLPITDSVWQNVHRTRALHLLGRAERLSHSPAVSVRALELLAEMEKLVECVEAHKFVGMDEAVGVIDEDTPTSLPTPSLDPRSASPRGTGTIPKVRFSENFTLPTEHTVDLPIPAIDPVANLRLAKISDADGVNTHSDFHGSPGAAGIPDNFGKTPLLRSQTPNARLGQINTVASSQVVPITPPVVPPRPPLVTSLRATPNHNPSSNRNISNSTRRRSPIRTAVFKWRISFDGTSGLDVSDFLFRVERLAEFERVNDDDLYAGFHSLLTGKAAAWYWLYLRGSPSPTWAELSAALMREFQNQESDYEIRKLVESRQQGGRESFSDFRLAVHTLVCKMVHPIPEVELIQILRRNMKPALQEVLLLHSVNSILDLRELCNRFEKLSSHIGQPREQAPRRSVHELYSDQPSNYDCNLNNPEPQQALEAFQVRPSPQLLQRNPTTTSPYQPRILKCWNCSREGHTYQNCPIPVRKLFCFGCGAEGVIKPKCNACSPENRVRSQHIAGTARILTPAQVPRRLTEEAASNTEPERNR